MKIAVDIDDTLNIVERVKFASEYIARKKLPYRIKDEFSNMFVQVYDWEIDAVLEFIHDGGVAAFTEAQARPHARETLEHWKKQGHEIIVLTARQEDWFGDPEAVSREWLDKNNIPYHKIVANISKHAKGKYCAENGISVLVDDNADSCLGAQEYGVHAILALGRHNAARADEIAFGGENWREIDRRLQQIAQTVQTQDALMRCNPAMKEEQYDGWAFRFDRRGNRRLNSIRLTAPSVKQIAEKISFAEERYAAERKPCRFLLTPSDKALDGALGARGYALESPSEVWTLEEIARLPLRNGIITEETPSEEWRGAFETLKQESFYGVRSENGLFVRLYERDEPIAVVCGVTEGVTLCVYHLFVRADRRRKGYGKAILEGLLCEAKTRGATRACLQVEADNFVAKSLYRAEGFEKTYEYWYRLQSK